MIHCDDNGYRLEALESRRLLAAFQSFAPPTPSAALHDETTGKDGSVYFVEADQQQIGRILPNKSIVEYTIPDSFGDIGKLVTAKDGSIWFNTTNADHPLLGHLTTRGRVSAVAIHADAKLIAASTDGSVWAAGPDLGAAQVSARGSVKYFATNAIQNATAITAGRRGDLYFIQDIVSADVHGTEYDPQLYHATLSHGRLLEQNLFGNELLTDSAPTTDLLLGPDGNAYFNVGGQPKLWYLTPQQYGQLSDVYAYNIGGGDPTLLSNASNLTVGPDRKVWFVDRVAGGKIWSVDSHLTVTHYDLPGGATATPFAIAKGAGNTLWITDDSGGVLDQLNL